MKKTVIMNAHNTTGDMRSAIDAERTVTPMDTRVLPMLSTISGKAVNNQYVMIDRDRVAFQSYHSLIAVYDRPKNTLFLGCDWNYSRTTSKYLREWLRMYAASFYARIMKCSGSSYAEKIRNAIKSGIVVYVPDMK